MAAMRVLHFMRVVCLAALLLVTTCISAQSKSAEPWTAAELATIAALRFSAQPFAQPRWETSLTAARQRALAEQKPIFMVVNTGHCLGYV